VAALLILMCWRLLTWIKTRANLVFDGANVGIGTTSPTTGRLQIVDSDVSSGGRTPLELQTSTGVRIFSFYNANSNTTPVPIINGFNAWCRFYNGISVRKQNSGGGDILNLNNYLNAKKFGFDRDGKFYINRTSGDATIHATNLTDIVAHRIDLSNGQTADAFQINSYGNTGGDLFKVEDDGKTIINGASFSGIFRTLSVGGAIGYGVGSYQGAINYNWTGGIGGVGMTSSHSFGIATAGVLGLVQDTNQNVGIGTSSPSTTLHAVGGVTDGIGGTRVLELEASFPSLWFKDTGGGSGLSLNKYGNSFYFSNTNSSGAHQNYAGMLQLSTGKWTIGSGNNPLGQLDVKVQVAGNIGQVINLSNGQTADAFQINSYGNTGGDLFKVGANGYVNILQRLAIGTSSTPVATLDVPGTSRMGVISNNYINNYTNTHSVLQTFTGTSDVRFYGSIGMGTSSPDASSLIDMQSTTKGFLPPRMTTTERNAIASPANGLLIYNITDNQFQYYNSGIANWAAV